MQFLCEQNLDTRYFGKDTVTGKIVPKMMFAIGNPGSTNITVDKYEDWTDNWLVFNINSTETKIKTKHTEEVSLVANTPYTITHGLGTERVIVQVYDAVSNTDVVVTNRTATEVTLTATTDTTATVIIL